MTLQKAHPFRTGREIKKLLKVLIWLILGTAVLTILSPLLCRDLFWDLPAKSAWFDCDDATLMMYQRLSRLGIKSTPILGDLKRTGEKYDETSHVWLLADICGITVPIDWGSPWANRQHYEGYILTYAELLQFVRQDFINVASSGSHPDD